MRVADAEMGQRASNGSRADELQRLDLMFLRAGDIFARHFVFPTN